MTQFDFNPSKNEGDVHVRGGEKERVSVYLAVTKNSDSNFFVGLAGTLNTGGLFVATHQMVAVGRRIDLGFELGEDDVPIRVQAEVSWQRTPVEYNEDVVCGFGVKMLDLDEDTRRRLDEFIAAREPIFHPE